MIFRIYKIRDERVGTFGTPLFVNKDSADFEADYKASIQLLKANAERAKENNLDAEFVKDVNQLTQLKDCAVYSSGIYDGDTGKFTIEQDTLCFRMVDLVDFALNVSMPELKEIEK